MISKKAEKLMKDLLTVSGEQYWRYVYYKEDCELIVVTAEVEIVKKFNEAMKQEGIDLETIIKIINKVIKDEE